MNETDQNTQFFSWIYRMSVVSMYQEATKRLQSFEECPRKYSKELDLIEEGLFYDRKQHFPTIILFSLSCYIR